MKSGDAHLCVIIGCPAHCRIQRPFPGSLVCVHPSAASRCIHGLHVIGITHKHTPTPRDHNEHGIEKNTRKNSVTNDYDLNYLKYNDLNKYGYYEYYKNRRHLHSKIKF